MWHGLSSYQLVFGKNPNSPNIITDKPPALQGTTTSEVLAKHLNALHASRRAFIQSESDERIRRALRGKVRASEQRFTNGELVYYKRQGHERWLGPAKVVFQDGKVVFVRHGGTFVRVSPNHLLKAGVGASGDVNGDNETVERRINNSAMKTDGSGLSPIVEEVRDDTELSAPSVRSGPTVTPLPGGSVESESAKLKTDDKIRYRTDPQSEWTTATVLGRAGKVSGKFKCRYNVRDEESQVESSVDLSLVPEWRKVDTDQIEHVNAVMIPRSKQDDPACLRAKEAELQKLKDFGTYERRPMTVVNREYQPRGCSLKKVTRSRPVLSHEVLRTIALQ
jgi:hypothetical protein